MKKGEIIGMMRRLDSEEKVGGVNAFTPWEIMFYYDSELSGLPCHREGKRVIWGKG